MNPNSKSKDASIGFCVRSGYAIAVIIDGEVKSPHVVSRSVVEMYDHQAPETKQPYHARMGTLENDTSKISWRKKVIEEVTVKSINGLLKSSVDGDYTIRNAALVVGSETDPASIANEHIRAHALEGQLFRTVLQKALDSHTVPVAIILKRDLFALAQKKLGRSEDKLKQTLTSLGITMGKPWRTDEKIAVLAAWLNL